MTWARRHRQAIAAARREAFVVRSTAFLRTADGRVALIAQDGQPWEMVGACVTADMRGAAREAVSRAVHSWLGVEREPGRLLAMDWRGEDAVHGQLPQQRLIWDFPIVEREVPQKRKPGSEAGRLQLVHGDDVSQCAPLLARGIHAAYRGLSNGDVKDVGFPF